MEQKTIREYLIEIEEILDEALNGLDPQRFHILLDHISDLMEDYR